MEKKNIMLSRDKEETRIGLNREEDGKTEYEYGQLNKGPLKIHMEIYSCRSFLKYILIWKDFK